MKNFIYLFVAAFLIAGIEKTQAQANSSDSTSLNGQYQTMLKRSKTELGYKVINPYRLSTLWKNITDTLNAEKKKLRELQKKTDAQSKVINEQKSSLSTQQQSLLESQTKLDEVNLLGISINKTTYNAVMWGLVVLLALALAIVIFRSGSNRREARYRIKLFDELSAEFQAHKVKANEKEKKLARELQDERNKLDDLLRK